MPLADRILDDNARVFVNPGHFATWHTWGSVRILCVTDEETALKRKNNNVVDLSWDNNTTETVLHVEKSQLPKRPTPNDHIIFDRKPMKILQVQEDIGMYTILLVSQNPRPMTES